MTTENQPRASFHQTMELVKASTKDPFVLQIGAMDGVLFDMLHPHLVKGDWRGILVEPLPDMFASLQRTYAAHPALTLKNLAISDHAGTLTLRRIDPLAVAQGLLPKTALGLTSGCTDRGVLSRPDYIERNAAHILEIQVPCLPLQNLLDEQNVEKIDVVVIDTEGADWSVLQQLDLTHYTPRFVCIEYAHLTQTEVNECCKHMAAHGYGVAHCHEDAENVLFYKNG